MSYDLGSFIESEDDNNLADDFSDTDFSDDSESLEQDFSDVTDEDDLEDVINDKLTKLNESIAAGDKQINEELSSQIISVQQTATSIANIVNGQAVLKTGAGVLIYTPDKTGKKINISGDGETEISAYPPKTDSAVLKAANEGLVIGPSDGSTGVTHNVASFNKSGASFIGYDSNNTPKSMLVLNSSGIGLGTPDSNTESLDNNYPKLEIVSNEIKLSNGDSSSMSLTASGFSIASPGNTLKATSSGVSISSGSSGKLTVSSSGINGVFYCGGNVTKSIAVNKKSYKLFNFTYNDILSINSKGIPSSDGNWFPYALVRAQIINPEGLVISSWDINPSCRDDNTGKPIVQIGVYNTTNAKITKKNLKFQILWMNGNYSDDSDDSESGSTESIDQSIPEDNTLTPLYGKYDSSTNKLTITTAIS